MLAAVYHGEEDLRVEEVPLPKVGEGEILVRVRSASICGTDLRIYQGQHRKYPPGTRRIPGHEVVGSIAAVGTGVEELQEGQMVFIAPNMGCGHCGQCVRGNNNLCAQYDAIGITIDGAFAEYMLVPAKAVQQGNVMPVSGAVDPAVAALIEPFACVLRGQNAVQVGLGDVVVVMGAGPIGLMHLKLAKLRGAGRVIVSEPNPKRLERALELGADRVVNPEQENLQAVLEEETGGQGADVLLVAAPSHVGQEIAVQLAAIGGRINFFGGLPKDRPVIQLDSNQVHYKELVITGTTACSTGDCRQAARLINYGKIDLSDLISSRFPLQQTADAFEIAQGRGALKVVIEP
jgi:L-iditol 2-dehydrogenase